MNRHDFHPAVAAWFAKAFPAATPAQLDAWPAIQTGRHALIAAPTGSGKTLAAFLAAIDELVRLGVAGTLTDEVAVVYVSPLKALSNDIRINLEQPLAGIREELAAMGAPDVEVRAMVRTGDTPQGERTQMRRRPPHILVTTPESLYVLLGSESGRAMLASTRSVIVDEIHALAPNKRGSHLSLSLERLEALCERRLVRIGLSATQRPIDEVARFLVGARAIAPDGTPDCAIVDRSYSRERDLALELPPVPLEPVMSGETWQLVYDRLAELVNGHRTTLVFVNTRRMTERVSRHLSERLGRDVVAAHHGSLSKEHRLDAEQRLKRGQLKVLVATASLELGIDIGDVDLVCQLGSPRAIAAFLQRVGRSGHAVGATPKGRLFPQSRDDLVECAALLDAVRRGELDTIVVPRNARDVLAQQISADVANRDWVEDELFATFRNAWPYATLERAEFDSLVQMLAQGFTTRRGPRAALIHRDAVNGVLHARRSTRLTALTSGGAIPDTADYDVVLEPAGQRIGSINEDFAIESLAGDVFQLGNASYRVLRIEAGRMRVEDAQGAPPSIPFWLGEAPGRSNALSQSVSRLRGKIDARVGEDPAAAVAWLEDEAGIDPEAAQQLGDYFARTRAALGAVPTQSHLVMERFFDESGGTQLVIHTPYGSRINRAWGLALRKRFCRKFNFELQAAATEDAIILSLSTSHSFPLIEVSKYLHSSSVREVLVQAMLDAPMFGLRWRWNATIALALPRFQGGTKVAPQLQRMRSEDLLATVFPDQVACAENLVGERQVPDHPLVKQTIEDCLHEAMDIEGLEALLRGLESGAIAIDARDLPAPSPLAAEVLGSRPYTFLDDAPLEERRTQAVQSRRYGDADDMASWGRLDPEAIASVREEAWPEARDADELHEALTQLGCLTQAEIDANPAWPALMAALASRGRAARMALPMPIWVATECLPMWRAVHAEPPVAPDVRVPDEFLATAWTRDDALREIVRARIGGLGPVRVPALAAAIGVAPGEVDVALLRLEAEGFAMRGFYSSDGGGEEWCERHLLARIHRYTIGRLRREIEPVTGRDLMRFLGRWQRLDGPDRVSGPEALVSVLAQLEGYEAPASSWEGSILPARVEGYEPAWLDDLCLAGRVAWTRLRPRAPNVERERHASPVRATPIVLLPRRAVPVWARFGQAADEDVVLSSRAQAVYDALAQHGASFFDELASATRLLRTELEDALGELVAHGLVNSDAFTGLRALLAPAGKRGASGRRARACALMGIEDAGRWSRVRRAPPDPSGEGEAVEHVARTLLRRYGVVCWRLLAREAHWLPRWRDLLRVFQRLEARGEIRGGRFVAGLSGEQFALPEALALLRKVRNEKHGGNIVCVSGADPLNLAGFVVAAEKLPALASARIAYRDGLPVATLVGEEITWLEKLEPTEAWRVQQALAGRSIPASAVPPVEAIVGLHRSRHH